MNALLEAMKKLSSGAVSEMEPAMARLENSFAQVEVAIQAHQASGNYSSLVTNPAPITIAPINASNYTSTYTVPVQPVPVVPANNYNVTAPVTPVTPTTPEPLPTRPVAAYVSSSPEPVPESHSRLHTFPAQPIPINDVSEPDPAETLQAATEATRETFVEEKSGFEDSSLASTGQKVLTPQDLPDPASLATSEDGDPLFTKEVDDGLEQLLADWSLFKKSGLFGTGPKGREHPLFKKIADLQVPLLLAGRFEGSTQEIRQSVTDYMNGWRYEQGIIYSPGETFEKYLRRVIKHILDLQKSRK
ncbi:MAG: hypothetical protein R3B53_04550 [Candidatus Paceibacterota bacterium]